MFVLLEDGIREWRDGADLTATVSRDFVSTDAALFLAAREGLLRTEP